ncbi:MAG: sugar ABC transporter ATP-binding protein [Rhodobacter sp.]|nr:sugar ABC transporter ATP-binding protein [Rhodobacter sp.]
MSAMTAEEREAVPLLDAKGVSKSFGTVRALSDAGLKVNAGEIVALVGANGAGKSTFVKILTGVLQPDSGNVTIRGSEVHVGSPAKARRSGLVPVYQEPSLIPDLDVRNNLRLSDTPEGPFLNWVNELGLRGLRLDDMVGHLPLATLRILDLAKALACEPDVLLLDEMTAALPTDLVERTLRVVRSQAECGRGVIFISHRFSEISQLCHRASILRDGATVGDLAVRPGVEDRVVEMMLGAGVESGAPVTGVGHVARPRGTPRLEVEGLAQGGKLSDVSFEIHPGEVLGLVALEGQGQDELFEVLSGLLRPDRGVILIDGTPVSFRHPADAIAAGFAYVPGDRAEALLMERSVHENIALPFSTHLGGWGPIRLRRERASVGETINRLQIDTRARGAVRRLSGGNQQKVTIGRWLAVGFRMLLLFDPTRGIDVRTKRQIYPLVRQLAERGASILYYTSELDEVPLVCDRVLVIFNGCVVATLAVRDANESTLVRAAYGLSPRDACGG